ncbi:exopolysaccharide biosynthesis protein [Brevundimonas sp.]|uniref:exopolysaccharide biosynthesis protein n=1 Tax=Brevundimonas sp. TaxID=1871086 RepID=UPI002737AAE4|nr:exopolysaccharide biosynthesis protein [Brevundimonas sp.]MDP3801564.1 exopolysaccharide biosynthesis protein [Brevundimonas sp.]
MTLIETSTGRPRAFSEVLAILAARRAEKLCLGEVVEAFGDRAFGPVMFFFALINLLPWPPGGTTLTGAPLLLLSMELAWGRDTLWIPRWAERVSINRSAFRKLSGRLARPVRWSERLSRPRLYFLTGGFGQGLIGLACLFLSAVLVLPIFGGNLIPAVAIAFFSLGVIQRDGLAVLLGWLTTAFAVAILFLAWKLIVAGLQQGLGWIAGLV